MRDDAGIVPYKWFASFVAISKVSPRQDEGIPPYSIFIGRQYIIKCSVGNGLDRSDNYAQMRTLKRKYSRYSAYTLYYKIID